MPTAPISPTPTSRFVDLAFCFAEGRRSLRRGPVGGAPRRRGPDRREHHGRDVPRGRPQFGAARRSGRRGGGHRPGQGLQSSARLAEIAAEAWGGRCVAADRIGLYRGGRGSKMPPAADRGDRLPRPVRGARRLSAAAGPRAARQRHGASGARPLVVARARSVRPLHLRCKARQRGTARRSPAIRSTRCGASSRAISGAAPDPRLPFPGRRERHSSPTRPGGFSSACRSRRAPISRPEIDLWFHDVGIAFDVVDRRAFLVSTGWPEEDPSRRGRRVYERAEWLRDRIDSAAAHAGTRHSSCRATPGAANMTAERLHARWWSGRAATSPRATSFRPT